jgi:alpha-ketoglutarate-dependent 2,4-dichlorophenoxyacetate dioxygenase
VTALKEGNAMALSIQRLQDDFGAEVTGADLTRPMDDALFGAIRDAFEEYCVLVFRDQDFDDASQIAFSQRFGPLELTVDSNSGGGTPIADISNVDPLTDQIIPVDSWLSRYNSGNEMWHTDSSFKEVPALASLLSGREVPPEGAQTQFASMRTAYGTLSQAEQERLENLVAVHDFAYSRGQVDPELLNEDQKKATPPVRHAVVRTNPANGRKGFYSGAHASHIVGWPVEKGRALLKNLVARAVAPDRVYTHQWRPLDLVIWDNRCILHRGLPWDKARYRRVMHRTTVAGDGPTA